MLNLIQGLYIINNNLSIYIVILLTNTIAQLTNGETWSIWDVSVLFAWVVCCCLLWLFSIFCMNLIFSWIKVANVLQLWKIHLYGFNLEFVHILNLYFQACLKWVFECFYTTETGLQYPFVFLEILFWSPNTLD